MDRVVPSRRSFLKTSMGACVGGALAGAAPSPPRTPVYYKAIFDERFEAGRRFASRTTVRDISTVAIRGDMTGVFLEDLDLRWKRGPVLMAGYTTAESLFCLDLLARDRGMRLVHADPAPDLEASMDVLDGARPRRVQTPPLPFTDPQSPVFWIIAPRENASAKESTDA